MKSLLALIFVCACGSSETDTVGEPVASEITWSVHDAAAGVATEEIETPAKASNVKVIPCSGESIPFYVAATVDEGTLWTMAFVAGEKMQWEPIPSGFVQVLNQSSEEQSFAVFFQVQHD